MTNLIKHWIFYVQQNQRIKHSFEMELNVLSRVQIISNPPTLSSIVHVTGKKCFVFEQVIERVFSSVILR